jgi:hypothetical protein
MQSGDRLGYHPELALQEIAHFHGLLPAAQAAVDDVAKDFPQRLNEQAQHMSVANRVSDVEAQKVRRLDALARAQRLIADAANQAASEPVKETAAPAEK